MFHISALNDKSNLDVNCVNVLKLVSANSSLGALSAALESTKYSNVRTIVSVVFYLSLAYVALFACIGC